MSDEEDNIEEKPFAVERAKQGRAVCKKCKQKCLQGELRLAKLVYNPFGGGKMKAWHHVSCLFEAFLKQRKTTKRIENPDEIDGWDLLSEDDQNDILKLIEDCNATFGVKTDITNTKQKKGTSPTTKQKKPTISPKKEVVKTSNVSSKVEKHQSFKEFRKLVADITNTNSYLDKTRCVKETFSDIFPDASYKDDIILWCRLLLPGVVKRVYNLQSRQLIKLFSRLFVTDQNDMLSHLEQGDIGETIQYYFEESVRTVPAKKSSLKVIEVDNFLNKLTNLTKEDEQLEHFKPFVLKCTSNDLKTVVRLIKGDLRMGAGAKHILEAIHSNAYENYQISRDLEAVITQCLSSGTNITKPVKGDVVLLTPVLPMLAEACKSVEQAMKKCPNGMYSEIKYDGERVQVHKCGKDFKYFSRALKPVLPHKIQHFKEYIPKAFPHANDLVLDCEVLMVDTNTGKPLPFGTLGKHKKTEFKDASVCLFVFDCLYYNGESLLKKPLCERKKIIQDNMSEIQHHVMFSEMQEIHQKQDLAKMIAKVLKLGLEGLVLKDIKSIYEPGKRHWLKVKKDYLFDGAMADSADLIVLGAWYGTGKKGGMMSVFLMGCHNPKNDTFCTVTKVHTGHDDKTLERLQSELNMIKISQDQSKVPNWLKCTKTMIPDFVARNPREQPIWEITGAEFTQIHDVHTADGISIRFPRVTQIRSDKDWKTATNLDELRQLYINSKENPDISLLVKGIASSDGQQVNNIEEKKRKSNSSDSGENTPKKKKITEKGFDNSSIKVDNIQGKKPKWNSTDSAENTSSKTKKISEQVNIQKDTSIFESNSKNNNIFNGVNAIVTDDLQNKEQEGLIKNFISYGGRVLSSEDYDKATHAFHYYNIIREPLLKSSCTTRHVSFEWVKDSIKEEELQDYRLYTVQWNPDT